MRRRRLPDASQAAALDPVRVLPKDVWLHLLQWLDRDDLNNCACVSRSWKALALNDSLWRSRGWSRRDVDGLMRLHHSRVRLLVAVLGMNTNQEEDLGGYGRLWGTKARHRRALWMGYGALLVVRAVCLYLTLGPITCHAWVLLLVDLGIMALLCASRSSPLPWPFITFACGILYAVRLGPEAAAAADVPFVSASWLPGWKPLCWLWLSGTLQAWIGTSLQATLRVLGSLPRVPRSHSRGLYSIAEPVMWWVFASHAALAGAYHGAGLLRWHTIAVMGLLMVCMFSFHNCRWPFWQSYYLGPDPFTSVLWSQLPHAVWVCLGIWIQSAFTKHNLAHAVWSRLTRLPSLGGLSWACAHVIRISTALFGCGLFSVLSLVTGWQLYKGFARMADRNIRDEILPGSVMYMMNTITWLAVVVMAGSTSLLRQ